MKIKNNPPRPGIPTHFKDRIVVRYDPKFGAIAQSWPRRNPGGSPRGNPDKVALWDAAIEWTKRPEPSEYAQALQATNGTAFYARDIIISAIYGNYISWPGWGWRVQMAQNIQAMLDSIVDTPGSILYRAEDGWHGLAPGTDAQVLTMSALGAFPQWANPATTGITELTGDVIAGPGSGTQAAVLPNTGVVAATYTLASIQVDAKGRVVAAANGSVTPGITQLSGDVTTGTGGGVQAGTLANTGVVAASYTLASITVDAKGRVTSAASGNVTPGNSFQASPAAPATNNSLTGSMSGFGRTITPARSGTIVVSYNVTASNNVNGSGAFIHMRYGTGTPPANHAALTGTQVGPIRAYAGQNTNAQVPLSITAVITGLTVGTTYWVDPDYGSIIGGLTTWFDPCIAAWEI